MIFWKHLIIPARKYLFKEIPRRGLLHIPRNIHCTLRWFFVVIIQFFRATALVLVIMTSSNRYIFRVTGPLRWESTGHRWIPLTKVSDAELLMFFICAWTNGWANYRSAVYLRRHHDHYGVTVINSYAITQLPLRNMCKWIPRINEVCLCCMECTVGVGMVNEWLWSCVVYGLNFIVCV